MRMRNVKNAKKRIDDCVFLVKEPSSNYFENNNPIHLEIGMGKGQFLLNMALKYPDINFIGVEKFDKVVAKAIEKISPYELKNLKILKSDALHLEEFFSKKIDIIYLNFSDPWPKKKHHKRRLTNEIFLKIYDKLFKENNKLIIKTDHQELFEYSLISLNNYGYCFENLSLDLHKTDISNIMTEYEEKFSSKGSKIYYLVCTKNNVIINGDDE